MKHKTLVVRMWLYFFLFSCIIMLSLWLLQTVFLNQFYEGMKAGTMAEIAEEIVGLIEAGDAQNSIDMLAFQNDLMIHVADDDGELIYFANQNGLGKPNKMDMPPKPLQDNSADQVLRPRDYDDFLDMLDENNGESFTYSKEFTDIHEKTLRKMLTYGKRVNGYVLYINMPLSPVDSTIEVLRRQLLYVTAIAILLGLVIAYFISRKLSRPISNMTRSAAKLATGDYDVSFSKGSYAELDQLAETLNYTASELSKVEKLRRDLIANISHDFRTPLTMIKAYSELIRDISGDDKEKRQQHLDIIVQESARLSRLVDDVLDLSMLQSGNEQLNKQNTDISALTMRVLSSFEPMIEQEGHKLSKSIQPDQYAYADETRMEQVIYNLLSNAVAHTGGDVEVWLGNKGGGIRCEVSDNGPGIPAEDLPYIWERYYTSSERPEKNSGLGLSIVKNILELHEARFGVESSPGRGSTFWFELNK